MSGEYKRVFWTTLLYYRLEENSEYTWRRLGKREYRYRVEIKLISRGEQQGQNGEM